MFSPEKLHSPSRYVPGDGEIWELLQQCLGWGHGEPRILWIMGFLMGNDGYNVDMCYDICWCFFFGCEWNLEVEWNFHGMLMFFFASVYMGFEWIWWNLNEKTCTKSLPIGMHVYKFRAQFRILRTGSGYMGETPSHRFCSSTLKPCPFSKWDTYPRRKNGT